MNHSGYSSGLCSLTGKIPVYQDQLLEFWWNSTAVYTDLTTVSPGILFDWFPPTNILFLTRYSSCSHSDLRSVLISPNTSSVCHCHALSGIVKSCENSSPTVETTRCLGCIHFLTLAQRSIRLVPKQKNLHSTTVMQSSPVRQSRPSSSVCCGPVLPGQKHSHGPPPSSFRSGDHPFCTDSHSMNYGDDLRIPF